jgi:hypothetical protein
MCSKGAQLRLFGCWIKCVAICGHILVSQHLWPHVWPQCGHNVAIFRHMWPQKWFT